MFGLVSVVFAAAVLPRIATLRQPLTLWTFVDQKSVASNTLIKAKELHGVGCVKAVHSRPRGRRDKRADLQRYKPQLRLKCIFRNERHFLFGMDQH